MMKKRPFTLSIAGFDPSGGAGLISDCKTFEALKCQGFAVCTAQTIQNDTDFSKCYWTDSTIIMEQIEILYKRFSIDVVKIGIIPNWETLLAIVTLLKQKNPEVKIIVDPVLKATAGFDFHTENTLSKKVILSVLEHIYILTPNYPELEILSKIIGYTPSTDPDLKNTFDLLTEFTNIYLKGGHHPKTKGKDVLFTKEGRHYTINPKHQKVTDKHGSGCVLSSALAAYIAQGYPLLKSVYKTKRFTERYLGSSSSLLGNFRF